MNSCSRSFWIYYLRWGGPQCHQTRPAVWLRIGNGGFITQAIISSSPLSKFFSGAAAVLIIETLYGAEQ